MADRGTPDKPAKPRRRWLRRLILALAILLLLPPVTLAVVLAGLATDPGRAVLAGAIDRFAQSDTLTVSVDGIGGHPLTGLTLDRLTVGDPAGTWLTVEAAVLEWSPSALLDRHLSIQELSAGRLHLERLPQTGEGDPPGDGGPPSLPTARLTLDRLQVDTLSLGAAVAGAPARLSVSGAMDIAAPAGPGQLDLRIDRIDERPGALRLTAALDPGPQAGIADDTLTLDLTGAEPADGVLAGLLGLPGRPAVSLTLAGSGPIRDFQAALSADATDLATVSGAVRIEGAVDAASLTGQLDVTARPGPGLPALWRDLAGPNPTLALRLHRTADGDILVERADLLSAVADLSAEGRVDPAGDIALDLTLDARAEAVTRLAPGLGWSAATLSAQVTGETRRPSLSAELALRDLSAPGGVAAGAADLTLTAAASEGPAGPLGEARLTLLLTDPVLPGAPPALLAAPIRLTAAGEATAQGRVTLTDASLESARVTAEASGSALAFGTQDLSATATVGIGDLDGLAGPTTGAADLSLTIARAASDRPFAIDATLAGTGLDTGLAAVSDLIGPAPTLTLTANATPAGAVDIAALTVSAAALSATAEGSILPGAVSIDWRAEMPALARLSPTIAGAMAMDGHLSGPFDALGGTIAVAAEGVTVAGEPIRDPSARLDFDQLPGAPRADLTASAAFRDRPLDLSLTAATGEDGTLAVETGRLTLPGATLDGSASVPPDGPPTAAIRLDLSDLSQIAALAGQSLQGSGTVAIDLTPTDGLTLDGDLAGLTLPTAGVTVDALAVTGSGRLPTQAAAADGTVTLRASGIQAGGQRIDRAVLTAAGDPTALDLTLEAEGAVGSLSTAAALDLSAPDRLIARLTRLTLATQGESLSLDAPATVALGDGGVTVDRLGLGGGLGQITAREIAVAADRLAGQVSLSLNAGGAAARFVPDLAVGGDIAAEASLGGTPAAPTVQAQITARGLTARPIRDAGLPAIAADARIALDGGQLATDATITAGDLADLSLTARLPVPPPGDGSGSLSASVTGTTDLAGLNALLAATGDRVAGRVDIDLNVTGSLAAPVAVGTVALSDGAYRNRASGLDLRSIAARLEGRDRSLRLTELSALGPNGGTLGGSGEITLLPERGLPLRFDLTTRQLQTVDRSEATAILSGDLMLVGAVLDGLALSGDIRVDRAELRAPDRVPVSVPSLDVIELNTPAELVERRAAPVAQGGPSAAPPIALDLTIDAPNRVFLRGFGADAELAGRLTVTGTAAAPRIGGFLEIVRGTLNFLGTAFALDEGRLTFNEAVAPDPTLSLAAVTPTGEGTATVGLGGTLTNPEITLSATPSVPEDEILSQILFGESTGELSALQAVQLAQALAAYAGLTDRVDPVSRARDLIGLDYLDVETDGEDGPTVEAGQVLTDRVRIGARQSLGGSGPSATVEIEILPELRLESEIGADGDTGVGVIFQRDY